MKVNIGDCSGCPAKQVRIDYRYTNPSQCLCTTCNFARLRKANAAKSAVRWANEKKARQSAPKPPKPKVAKPIARKPIVRKVLKPMKKKATKKHLSDLAKDEKLNREIWATKKHSCYECWKPLDFPEFPRKGVFSHVHSKGARADLRHVRMNVVIHCSDCHRYWETDKPRESMPRTLKLFHLIAVKHQDNKFQR